MTAAHAPSQYVKRMALLSNGWTSTRRPHEPACWRDPLRADDHYVFTLDEAYRILQERLGKEQTE